MEGKLSILICYGLMGLFIALWPSLTKAKIISTDFQYEVPIDSCGWLWKFSCFLVAILGVFLITGHTISTLVLSFALVALMLSLATGKFDIIATLCTFLALCVSTTLLWWHRHGHILNLDGFSMAIVCLFTFLFAQLFKINPNPSIKVTTLSKWLLPYMLFAAILSFSTGIFYNTTILETLWHHWGAYIGPAELLLSGATILHDFPAQYGLGPTFLIASVCGHDCWQGMYYIASFATWLFSIGIAALAFALTVNRWPERIITLSLCLATCFFWTAYPPLTGSPLETPSVSGLRFLPAIFLVTYLFFATHIEYSKVKRIIAHCFWAFGALWSPESAFYVTCVWWPYYIFICAAQGNITTRFKRLLGASIRLMLITTSLIVIFYTLFYIVYDKGPSLYAFLAYALNPPGPLPINPHGGILYFLMATSIGIINWLNLWRKSGDTFLFRSGFLIILLCYSVFSYFLGRSHDNNFLNISPFILLVLLYTISTLPKKLYLYRISVICLMALLGWLPAFGWEVWYDNISKGRLLSFKPSLFRSLALHQTLAETSNLAKNFNLDLSLTKAPWEAIHFLQHYKEPITVLNSTLSLMGSTHPVWNAIHSPANYIFIPPNHRRQFLQATAKALHRSGWLIVEKNSPAEIFLKDFDFVYQRTNYFDFGSYYAIRFVPKSNL